MRAIDMVAIGIVFAVGSKIKVREGLGSKEIE